MANEEDTSWLHERWEPTPEELERIEQLKLPSNDEIVGGFLISNPIVFGVPGRAEIFRLAHLNEESVRRLIAPYYSTENTMRLWVIKPAQLPFSYVVAAAPDGLMFGDPIEHNFNVRLQAVTTEMVLTRIRVLQGNEADDGPEIVFEGTETPGPEYLRQIRVVRITVHKNGLATHEVISETTYPA